MALLDICVYPDPILRKHALPVEQVDGGIRRLADDMTETMYEAPGIGLAANQVGRPIQVVVIHVRKEKEGEDSGLIRLINPQIVAVEGVTSFEEGCLSVPDFYSTIKRAERVTVRALDLDGNDMEIEASGLLAVVLQHEIDHLGGKLFIDHMNPIKRDIFKRKWKKRHRQAAVEA